MRDRRILVAVTQTDLLQEICRLLEQAGAKTGGATSGHDALQQIEQGNWEFVLCSSQLHGDDCREVCELLREFSTDPPRVILLVPQDELDPETQRENIGADAVLKLPLEPGALAQTMRLLDANHDLSARLEALKEENRVLGERLAQAQPSAGRLVRFELFRGVMVAEVKKAQRYGYPLSLLVLAVDRFRELAGWLSEKQRKQYFDRFFEALAHGTREIDIAVMFAEDKLLVLMPHTPVDGAAVVADRIRARVAENKPPASLRQLHVTVSISVAATGGGDEIQFGAMVGKIMRGLKEAEMKGGDAVIVCRSSAAARPVSPPAAENGQLGPRIFFL